MPLSKFCRLALLILLVSSFKLSQKENKILASDLSEPVEILRNQWEINHIYANNQRDLFEMWTKNEYFSPYFLKEKIKEVTDRTTLLVPTNK